MAVGMKFHIHIANNCSDVTTSCEQQSISSEISNPRQESKGQQSSETVTSPSYSDTSELQAVMMDDKQPVPSIPSPPLSPQHQYRSPKNGPQNTNDSRKMFVGGLPKDGGYTTTKHIVHLLFLLLNLVFCFLSYHYIFIVCSDGGRILLLLRTVRRNYRLVHCLRS